MLTAAPGGTVVGGATDVNGNFDDTLTCSATNCTSFGMTLASSQPFFGLPWTAHHIRVFEPGSYTFDTNCTGAQIAAGITSCGGGAALNLNVSPGQLGVQMLFDYGAPDGTTSCGVASCDIDVAVLWNYKAGFGTPIYQPQPTDPDGAYVWNLVSIDGDGSGVRGIAMVDGPFVGFNANFNLEMSPVLNAPPVANNDNVGVTADVATDINVIANDTDIEDGSPPPAPPAAVAPTTATSTQGFALSANANGTITYTPTGGYTGADDFQYTLTDSDGGVSIPATVNITVTAAPNTPPVTTDPTIPTNEDTSVDIPVASAATDVDGDPLTYVSFDATSAQGGSVTVDGTNTILTYTPAANFNGTDTFAYTVNDGIADSNVGTMTINVAPVNDALVCANVSLTTDTNQALSIDVANELLSTCTDPDTGDTISLDSTTQPVEPGSMLAFDGLNTLTYTPATDFNGDDTFTYTATDGTVTDTKTVTIAVGADFGNFTMLDSNGDVFGGTNDVLFEWDGSTNNDEVDYTNDLNFNMTIVSSAPWPFFGFVWTAHDIRVFGPGTYSFDTGCTVAEIQATGCPAGSAANSGPTITMTVGPGQLGAHILFDWNVSTNIDVVNVWNQDDVWDTLGATAPKNELWTGATGPAPDPTTTWALVSTDSNGDGVVGSPMVDGPFQGFYANFNSSPGATAPPKEPYTGSAPDTKIGSGLFASPMNPWVLVTVFMTLFGARRFGKKRY